VTTNVSSESEHVLPAPITSLAYAMDGQNLYAASGRILYNYDIKNLNGKYEHKLIDFDEELIKVLYVKEFKFLALGFKNGAVKLVDPISKSVIAQFKDHQKRITDLCIVKFNGAHALASTSKDYTINIYDLDEKALKNTLKVASSKTNSHANRIIYGHDEKTVFTIHDDGKIILNQYHTGSTDREQTNKDLISSSGSKLSSGLFVGDGSTFIVGTQGGQDGRKGKVEIYTSK